MPKISSRKKAKAAKEKAAAKKKSKKPGTRGAPVGAKKKNGNKG